MAWLNNKRYLPLILLDSNKTPSVNKICHLRNSITKNIKPLVKDMEEKKARYIDRNNEIMQKCFFASLRRKVKINNI